MEKYFIFHPARINRIEANFVQGNVILFGKRGIQKGKMHIIGRVEKLKQFANFVAKNFILLHRLKELENFVHENVTINGVQNM